MRLVNEGTGPRISLLHFRIVGGVDGHGILVHSAIIRAESSLLRKVL